MELLASSRFLIPFWSGLLVERGAMKRRRRRVAHISPLEERLAEEAKDLRARATKLPPGSERDGLLRRARHDEAAAHMAEWLMSPGSLVPI
ncbi:hypothetical protein ACVIGA_008028 [Bradyrhizobium sp. USDA 3240]